MPIGLDQLAKNLTPSETVLLFGAGSSIPSGAPLARALAGLIAQDLSLDSSSNDYSLTEIASLAEQRRSRAWLIAKVRDAFVKVTPTGGIRNIALYDWRSLYTTNYDTVIEACYASSRKPIEVFSSNFDFTGKRNPLAARLFKLHGSIEKDESDGHRSKLIVTDKDYEQTEEYREQLFDTLKGDLAGSDLVIIGHSLADPDIKAVIDRAHRINHQVGRPRKIW